MNTNLNFNPQKLLDDMITFVAVLDKSGTIIFVNNTPLKAVGMTLDSLTGKKFWDAAWWTYSDAAVKTIKTDCEKCAKGEFLVHEIELATADGSLIWIEYSMHPTYDDAGNIEYLIPEGRDISNQKRAEDAERRLLDLKEELILAQAKYQETFSKSPDGYLTLDTKDFLITDCNRAAEKLLQRSSEDIIGFTPAHISAEYQANRRKSTDEIVFKIKEVLSKGFSRFEWMIQRPDGTQLITEVTLGVGEFGGEEVILSTFRDISKNKEIEKRLELLAHYDPLTGLPNRTLFSNRFQLALAQANRSKDALIAVCFLDIDHFKPINDTYGHEAGDKLLVEIAKRLQLSIREVDTVSRIGGDEFIMLINIASKEACQQLMGRIFKDIAAPYEIDTNRHTITISCGITLYPEDNADMDLLIRHADQAMYKAKMLGKNRFVFFDTEEV